MPALVDNQLVVAGIDKTPPVSKVTGDNVEVGDHMSVATLIIAPKSEIVIGGGRETSAAEVKESKELTETPEEVSVEETSEVPGVIDAEEDVEDTSSPATLDHDDSDSDVSSMTTGTPPISCGEDEDLKPPPASPVQDAMAVEIRFGERDVLDLAATLTAESWSLRPAVLPPMNLHMFWQNRAQYHRLGNYGSEESNMISCRYCGFQYILQK